MTVDGGAAGAPAYSRDLIPRWLRRWAGWLFLMAVLVAAHWLGGRGDADPSDLLPSSLPFPETYVGPVPETGVDAVIPLHWSLEEGSLAEPRGCFLSEGSAIRSWAHGGLGGSPGVIAEVCRTPSALVATVDYLITDPIDYLRPRSHPHGAVEWLERRLPKADHSRLGCILGTTSHCWVWILAARYGEYLVGLQFDALAGGSIEQDAFVRTAEGLDTFIAQKLAES